MNIIKIAYLNVIRRKGQSLFTGFITTLTIFVFVLVFSIFSIVQSGLRLSDERLGADIIVLPNEADSISSAILFTGSPQTIYMPSNIESKLKNINGVEKITPQFFTTTIDDSGCCSYNKKLRIVGIDNASDFILKPWFEENNLNLLKDDEIIIGSNIEVSLGNKTSILSHPFKVVKSLHTTGSGMDDTIFMNIDKARLLANKNFSKNLWRGSTPKDLVSSILVKTSKEFNIQNIVEEINNANLGAKATSTSSSIVSVKKQMASISIVILFLCISLLLISSLALIGRYNALAKDRKKEIGFLRALGIQKIGILKLVIFEASIISSVSGIIGSILGVIMVNPFLSILKDALILPKGEWSISTALINVVIGIVASLLLGFLASLYPAWKSSSQSPKDAISEGDIV